MTAPDPLIEKLLGDARALFLGLLDNELGGVYLIQDDRFAFVNARLAQLFRYSREELCCGLGPLDLTAPGDRALARSQIDRRVSGQAKTGHYVFRALRKDGSAFDAEVFGVATTFEGRPAIIGLIIDVSERLQAERDAADRLRFTSQLVDAIPSPVFYKDERGLYLGCNRAFEDYIGIARQDLVGKSVFDIAPAELAARYAAADQALFDQPGTQIYDAAVAWANGERRDVTFYKATFNRADGSLGGLVGVILDITERKRAEEELRLAHVAFTNVDEAIVVTDAAGTILDVNGAFSRITGYSREEAIGQNPRLLKSGRQDAGFYRAMWRALTEEGRWEGDMWNRRKDGRFYLHHAKISAVRDAEGRIARYVGVAADVTQSREDQSRIERMAYYDPLTNLPNRTLLADRLRLAIAQADRRRTLLAVCYLDLDGFKPINDSHGHEAGDRLLVEVARRLQACLRAGDTVARLGGDEFVVLLGDSTDVSEIEQAVQRLQLNLAAPLPLGAVDAVLTASTGVTIYPIDGHDPDTLLRHADQAMYVAKQHGKNRYHLFDPESDRRVKAHREVIARVEEGLAADEFRLHYQPKVDMRRGAVVGMEALIRWQHPEQGLLAPIAFLPIVEKSDSAITLGHWVLRQALRQMAAWAAAGLELPVSVNISGRHLQHESFVADLDRLLAEFPAVPPHWLELEILETTAMDDIEEVSKVIAACSDRGVSFALDDFGTGYSSLTYFRRLPTHLLKIDQSFVRDMLDDTDDLAIVEGVIGLARTFQRQIIAEGVETVEHGIPLLHFGCDLAQGYAIARPMPAERVAEWVRTWRRPAVWEMMASERWSREDFPLLLAEIHHRRWIDRVAALCEGSAEAGPPPLGTHQCRFGQWLYGIGDNRFGRLPAFRALEPAHDRVHVVARELLALQATDPAAAKGRLGELLAAREELERGLEQLKIRLGVNQGD